MAREQRLGRALARAGPERATAAFRPRPGGLVQRGDHRMGRAGSRGRGAKPARRRAAGATRRSASCARNLDGLRSTGDLERTILALDGAGVERAALREPRPRGGAPQATLAKRIVRGPGQPDRLRDPRSAGGGRPRVGARRSAAWLRDAQNRDGGWGFQPGAGSDPDSTGAALQGLARRAGEAAGRRAGAPPICAASSGDAAASRWPAPAPPTPSRPLGRSRGWSPPAPTRPRSGTGGRSPFDYLARPAGGRRPLPLLVVE